MLETEQNLTLPASSASRFVSGEDLTVGTYITVSRAVIELPRFLFGCDFQRAPEVPLRWQHMPQDSGAPMKIKAVSLPYVDVEDVSESTRVLDLRHCEVAALRSCGHTSFGKMGTMS